MPYFSRREILSSLLVAGAAYPAFGAERSDAGLNEIAVSHGLSYGCAVSSKNLRNDPALASAVAKNAGILVPEYELKAHNTWIAPGHYNFTGADYISDFAVANNMKMRGHTLIWHEANPDWLAKAVAGRPPETLMTDYIQATIKHFSGRVRQWDVVNEAVDPTGYAPDRLNEKSPWLQAYGPGYIETAFRAAHEADPNAVLFYCDGNTELDVDWSERRSYAVFRLLEGLVKAGAPVHGFAIQGHIKPFKFGFNAQKYIRFLQEVRSLGLRLIVSEFDVADIGGDPDPAKRDVLVATATRQFLDAVLQDGMVTEVLTWGLSDKYSWLSVTSNYQWPNGELSRGLPLDANMQKKPMWYAIADAIRQTPRR